MNNDEDPIYKELHPFVSYSNHPVIMVLKDKILKRWWKTKGFDFSIQEEITLVAKEVLDE